MFIIWAQSATEDLRSIAYYLYKHAPSSAEKVIRKICNAATELAVFPYRGREGKKLNTREFVISSLSYVIVYSVGKETVHIIRILHTAQNWPID